MESSARRALLEQADALSRDTPLHHVRGPFRLNGWDSELSGLQVTAILVFGLFVECGERPRLCEPLMKAWPIVETLDLLELPDSATRARTRLWLEFPDVNLWIVDQRRGVWLIKTMTVPRELRGKGLGSAAMRRLCELADASVVVIAGTPEAMNGPVAAKGLRQRKAWYFRFGFVPNRGITRLPIDGSIVRLPSPPGE